MTGLQMYKQNQGYGICGAKNVYSSRVKLDNWVEDEFGVSLAAQPRPPVGRYVTDSREKHCDPTNMTAHPSMTTIKMMSTAELKAKNKEGTSYAQLFNHGPDMTVDERFNSTYKRLFSQPSAAAFARQHLDLEKQKNKEKTREITSLYKLNATSQLMNSYQTTAATAEVFRPRVVDGESMPIPRVGKRHVLSETF